MAVGPQASSWSSPTQTPTRTVMEPGRAGLETGTTPQVRTPSPIRTDVPGPQSGLMNRGGVTLFVAYIGRLVRGVQPSLFWHLHLLAMLQLLLCVLYSLWVFK